MGTIVDCPLIDNPKIAVLQIFPTPLKAAADGADRDVVAAEADPLLDPADSKFGVWKFKKTELYPITGKPPERDEPQVAASGKGGLKRKTLVVCDEVSDTLKHQTASGKRRLIRLEWAQPSGNQIGVHKLGATRLVRKEFLSKGRLPRAVRSSDDQDFLHVSRVSLQVRDKKSRTPATYAGDLERVISNVKERKSHLRKASPTERSFCNSWGGTL